MKRQNIFFLLTVGILTLGIYKLNAQQAVKGLAVTPSNFELSIEPGGQTTQKVRLLNQTNQDVNIRVDRRNFTSAGEEGEVSITSEETPFSIASWIKVTPETINVPAGASREFTFAITAPQNAEAGGHFGSLVFATVPGQNLDKTGALLSQEIASLILLKVPGNVEEKAVVESFTSDKNFYELGPVSFTARIKNQGAVHIKPLGSVTIKGPFVNTSDPIEERNVFPGAIRKIPATVNTRFMLGKYTAEFIATYGSNNQQLYAYTTFYAFPVRIGGAFILFLIILFLIRKRLARALGALISGR